MASWLVLRNSKLRAQRKRYDKDRIGGLFHKYHSVLQTADDRQAFPNVVYVHFHVFQTMRWELYLLGRFQLVVDGQLTDEFEADSARALCAYLCLHADEAIRRDRLATLLWPEQSQESALRNLRTALSRLRRGIGLLSKVLRSNNQTVTLTLPQEDAWVDVLALRELSASIRVHPHRRLEGCPRCLAAARRIAELYTGDFLAGFTLESDVFGEWATLQREVFHRAALDAIAALCSHHLQLQGWSEAEQYARQALRLEPWREESHRHLMQALANSGQRTAALRQFHLCQQVLHREFDASPESATVALYEQIRSCVEQPGPKAGAVKPGQLPPTGPHWLDDLPFVGRQHELELLLDQLVAPTTRLVSLVGEGGVGKTRLAVRAARRVAPSFSDGIFYVNLNAEQAEQLTSTPASVTIARVAQYIANACAIPPNTKTSHENSVKLHLRSRSSLLLLDGFEQSEDALPFLLSLLEEAPGCVLLVTTHRPLSVRQEWVLRLEGLPIFSEVDAANLDAANLDAANLPESLLLFELLVQRRGVSTYLHTDHLNAAQQICEAVNGLPLGIELAVACLSHIDQISPAQWSAEELVRILQHATQLDQRILLDLPSRHRGLQALFDASWQLLDGDLQQMLASIAVLHSDFTPETAAMIIAAPTPDVAEIALWRLVERSLLQIHDFNLFRLHNRIHRFAVEKLTASDLEIVSRQRHARHFLRSLAEAENALDGSDSYAVQEHLVTVMEDLLAAWRFAIKYECWGWLSEAGYAFTRLHLLRGSYAEGERLLHEAIQSLRQSAILSPNEMARLLVAWSRLIGRLEPRQDAEAALTEALTFSDNDALRADILIELGWRRHAVGHTTEAAALLQDALTITARLNDARRRADALNTMAAVCQRRGEGPSTLSHLEEALMLARQVDDLTLAGIVLNNLSVYFSEIGEADRTLALLTEALAIHRTQRNVRMEVNSLYKLGVWHDARRRYVEAQQYYQQALTLAESIPDLDCILEIWTNIGISCDQMGDYTGALAATLHALTTEPLVNSPQLRCAILANLSLHYHHLGGQTKALEYARQTVVLAEAIEMPVMAAYGYDFQGHALLSLQRLAEAETAYYQALTLRQQLDMALQSYESRAGLARVKLAMHDPAAAAAWVAPIAAYLMEHTLEDAEEPLRVYWTVYAVLLATHDPRAETILTLSLDLLHRSADQISDSISRQRYLTQIDAHQRLLQAAAHRAEGGLPETKLTATVRRHDQRRSSPPA
jgi:DNA-binding SARP family transcriptional activator